MSGRAPIAPDFVLACRTPFQLKRFCFVYLDSGRLFSGLTSVARHGDKKSLVLSEMYIKWAKAGHQFRCFFNKGVINRG